MLENIYILFKWNWYGWTATVNLRFFPFTADDRPYTQLHDDDDDDDGGPDDDDDDDDAHKKVQANTAHPPFSIATGF